MAIEESNIEESTNVEESTENSSSDTTDADEEKAKRIAESCQNDTVQPAIFRGRSFRRCGLSKLSAA